MARCLIFGNARAGVMFASEARGEVKGCMIADNLYGLVTESGQFVGGNNGVFANKITNIANGEGLFVPPPPKIE